MKNLPYKIAFIVFAIIIPSITLGFIIYLNFGTSTIEMDFSNKFEVKGVNNIYNENKLLPRDVSLNYRTILQENKYGSSLAAVQIGLNFLEVRTTQAELEKKLTFAEPSLPTYKDEKYFWGNPQDGFVGNLNGQLIDLETGKIDLAKSTSLGIYNLGLAKLVKEYREDVQALSDIKLEDLKEYLSKKKVVLIWLANDDYYDQKINYYTPNNNIAEAVDFRVMVLTGYKTEKEKTTYYLIDPKEGRIELNEEILYKYWYRMQNQVLIIN